MGKPRLMCFAAVVYGQGHIFGEIYYVSLETAERLKDRSRLRHCGPGPARLHRTGRLGESAAEMAAVVGMT